MYGKFMVKEMIGSYLCNLCLFKEMKIVKKESENVKKENENVKQMNDMVKKEIWVMTEKSEERAVSLKSEMKVLKEKSITDVEKEDLNSWVTISRKIKHDKTLDKMNEAMSRMKEYKKKLRVKLSRRMK